jgi:hypothetical protein
MADSTDIFEALGWSHLDVAAKREVLFKIEAAAREQVISLIVTKLTPQDMLALDQSLQQGAGQEQVLDFLQARIPDLESTIQARVAQYKEDIIGMVRRMRAATGQTPPPADEVERALRMLNQPD